ncbi:hypothetical protein F4781DRAFT_187636 [Annulohypoxylon bovei var. microspora]|nr:hypothetical protein F4781DRAFT_187636 [Annulohypoxylon bovei var. microspora]
MVYTIHQPGHGHHTITSHYPVQAQEFLATIGRQIDIHAISGYEISSLNERPNKRKLSSTSRGESPSKKRQQTSGCDHCCGHCYCLYCRRRNRAVSCPTPPAPSASLAPSAPPSPPRYLADPVHQADPVDQAKPREPTTLDYWMSTVKPGAPIKGITVPKDWNDLSSLNSESFDDMSSADRNTKSQASHASSAAKPKHGSEESRQALLKNNIRLVYDPAATPEWVTDLLASVRKTNTYATSGCFDAITKIFIATPSQAFDRSSEATLETRLYPTFPFYYNTYHYFYSLAYNGEMLPNWKYITHSSTVGRKVYSPYISVHLQLFPEPENLKATRPDLVVGYNLPWITQIFNKNELQAVALHDACRITTEGIIFPYLFIEVNSGATGSSAAARDQLLTAGAAALAITKDLFPENNAIFTLAIDDRLAELSVMFIDESNEQTRYHMSYSVDFNLNQIDSVRLLQDTLMNIHEWGNVTRREMVAAAIKVAAEAGFENYAFNTVRDKKRTRK